MNIPGGIYVPMITPFSPQDESVDFSALAENTRRLCESGVAGLMPLGSNGEFRSLGDDEAAAVLRTVRRHMPQGIPLFAGAGRESAHATLAWIRRCRDEGADAVFVLTPSFFSKTVGAEGLARFYAAVADESPLPVLLYAAPGYAAGVELPADVVRALSAHPNVIGMKDTSGQPVEAYRDFCSPSFSMLAGSQGKLISWLDAGAVGGVLSAANYAPGLCVRLYGEYRRNPEGARRLDGALRAAGAAISGRFGVAGVKAAATLSGFRGGVARNPFGRLTPSDEAEVAAALASLDAAR